METIAALLPLHVTTPDGVKWLEFVAEPGASIYDQYKSMPPVLRSAGVLYRKASHNSDSFKIVYRECVEDDLAFSA